MQDLKELLGTLKIPVAYSHFNTSTNPPFVVYLRESTSNFGADDKVYKKFNNYQVELYTEYKDPLLEDELENIFDDNDIYYDVISEDYIEDEKMYQIIYGVTLEEDKQVISY